MKLKTLIISTLLLFVISGCASDEKPTDGKIRIVATTTMISDLVAHIGGDHVDVIGLMNAGVDPHLYKAKESDVSTFQTADLVVYNGVHLEAKLVDILDALDNTISLEHGLNESDLLDDGNGAHDPHIWFDVALWKKAALYLGEELAKFDSENAESYKENATKYAAELDTLQEYITTRIQEVDASQRVLVTAHDAFNYFARSNGFTVKSIQGISTQSEASTATISELAHYIASNKIKAVFTESSISPKTIQSLQNAVNAQGFEVGVGDELYSDSLKKDATYIETYTLNIDAIVNALK